MEEMFKEKMLLTMWTSQVYGNHDRMTRTKKLRPKKAVGQSMVYRQIAYCIIQNGIPCKGGKKRRSGKCLQYYHRISS